MSKQQALARRQASSTGLGVQPGLPQGLSNSYFRHLIQHPRPLLIRAGVTGKRAREGGNGGKEREKGCFDPCFLLCVKHTHLPCEVWLF